MNIVISPLFLPIFYFMLHKTLHNHQTVWDVFKSSYAFLHFTYITVCEEVGQGDEELLILFTVSPAVKSLTCVSSKQQGNLSFISQSTKTVSARAKSSGIMGTSHVDVLTHYKTFGGLFLHRYIEIHPSIHYL